MRNALLTCTIAAPLLFAAVAGSQSLPLSDFDFGAAEQHFKDLHLPGSTNLHDAELQSDGARGYGLPNPTAARAALPSPPPPPFSTELEWNAFYTYCGWDAIVRAVHLDSMAVLTSNKALIYTVSHFAVVDTIRADVPFAPGQRLVAYRVGGEVKEGDDRLRIDTPDMAPFEPQKIYVLQLRRDKDASVRQYSIPEGPTVTVRNGKVYPIAGRYAGLTGADAFPAGADYEDVRSTFVRVSRRKSCPGRSS
jgi:hypothetical protein